MPAIILCGKCMVDSIKVYMTCVRPRGMCVNLSVFRRLFFCIFSGRDPRCAERGPRPFTISYSDECDCVLFYCLSLNATTAVDERPSYLRSNQTVIRDRESLACL